MAWSTTADPDEFMAAAGSFLRARPAQNTVLLTIADTLGRQAAVAPGRARPVLGWWRRESGEVDGAFIQTPPRPVLVSGIPPEAVPSLVDVLAGVSELGVELGTAKAVAAEWRRRTGVEPIVRQRLLLYRLDQLTPPDPPPPGRARIAEPGDRELLLAWTAAVTSELGEAPDDVERMVDDKISYGGFVLWETGGVPVSMAGRTRPVAGMVRIAPVFTPPSLRGNGYASAVTAAVSRLARELADEVLLFTDLANPVSNSIYQRLGYRPVQERVLISLEP